MTETLYFIIAGCLWLGVTIFFITARRLERDIMKDVHPDELFFICVTSGIICAAWVVVIPLMIVVGGLAFIFLWACHALD